MDALNETWAVLQPREQFYSPFDGMYDEIMIQLENAKSSSTHENLCAANALLTDFVDTLGNNGLKYMKLAEQAKNVYNQYMPRGGTKTNKKNAVNVIVFHGGAVGDAMVPFNTEVLPKSNIKYILLTDETPTAKSGSSVITTGSVGTQRYKVYSSDSFEPNELKNKDFQLFEIDDSGGITSMGNAEDVIDGLPDETIKMKIADLTGLPVAGRSTSTVPIPAPAPAPSPEPSPEPAPAPATEPSPAPAPAPEPAPVSAPGPDIAKMPSEEDLKKQYDKIINDLNNVTDSAKKFILRIKNMKTPQTNQYLQDDIIYINDKIKNITTDSNYIKNDDIKLPNKIIRLKLIIINFIKDVIISINKYYVHNEDVRDKLAAILEKAKNIDKIHDNFLVRSTRMKHRNQEIDTRLLDEIIREYDFVVNNFNVVAHPATSSSYNIGTRTGTGAIPATPTTATSATATTTSTSASAAQPAKSISATTASALVSTSASTPIVASSASATPTDEPVSATAEPTSAATSATSTSTPAPSGAASASASAFAAPDEAEWIAKANTKITEIDEDTKKTDIGDTVTHINEAIATIEEALGFNIPVPAQKDELFAKIDELYSKINDGFAFAVDKGFDGSSLATVMDYLKTAIDEERDSLAPALAVKGGNLTVNPKTIPQLRNHIQSLLAQVGKTSPKVAMQLNLNLIEVNRRYSKSVNKRNFKKVYQQIAQNLEEAIERHNLI